MPEKAATETSHALWRIVEPPLSLAFAVICGFVWAIVCVFLVFALAGKPSAPQAPPALPTQAAN